MGIGDETLNPTPGSLEKDIRLFQGNPSPPPRGEGALALYRPATAVFVRAGGEAGEVFAARDVYRAHADEVRGEELGVQGVNAARGQVGTEADENDF